MLRRNKRIGSMADQGKHLFTMNWNMAAASEVPNIKQSTGQMDGYSETDGALLAMPLSGCLYDRDRVAREFNPIVQSSGNVDMENITTALEAVGIDRTYGLWNLNHSPVQSIFATGIIRKTTDTKHTLCGEQLRVKDCRRSNHRTRQGQDNIKNIDHGERTINSNLLLVEGLTNYHTVSQRTFHPIAAVQESQSNGRGWGWPSSGGTLNRGSNSYAPRGIMKVARAHS